MHWEGLRRAMCSSLTTCWPNLMPWICGPPEDRVANGEGVKAQENIPTFSNKIKSCGLLSRTGLPCTFRL